MCLGNLHEHKLCCLLLCAPQSGALKINAYGYFHPIPEQENMQSQLVAQYMPFFRLIARILTFCDKRELYLTVLQQTLSLSGSLWLAVRLTLALSGSY